MANQHAKRAWIYDLILFLFAPLLDLFFRDIEVRGSWRVPSKGAVILVAAPHANQVRAASALISKSANTRSVCRFSGTYAHHAVCTPPSIVAHGCEII